MVSFMLKKTLLSHSWNKKYLIYYLFNVFKITQHQGIPVRYKN